MYEREREKRVCGFANKLWARSVWLNLHLATSFLPLSLLLLLLFLSSLCDRVPFNYSSSLFLLLFIPTGRSTPCSCNSSGVAFVTVPMCACGFFCGPRKLQLELVTETTQAKCMKLQIKNLEKCFNLIFSKFSIFRDNFLVELSRWIIVLSFRRKLEESAKLRDENCRIFMMGNSWKKKFIWLY